MQQGVLYLFQAAKIPFLTHKCAICISWGADYGGEMTPLTLPCFYCAFTAVSEEPSLQNLFWV